MSDFSSTPLQPQQNNFNKSQAFAAALQRAKQIAAKINPGGATDAGQKRPLDDIGQEPEAKKLAAHSPPRTNTLGGGGSAGVGAGGGIAPPGMGSVMGGPVTSEDIKVPDKMVGLIIGRGGEQITRLQSESGCKIQMAPDSGGMPDRICTLTGNSQAISRAKELVNAIVHQRYKTEGPGGGGGMHDMGAPPQQQHGGGGGGGGGGGSFVEVMIPGPKVGLVIGKGGETIKMLQEKSGAKMVVIQDGPNQEAEKPLRITGDPQKVEHARQLVYELLAEKEQFLQQRGGGGRGGGGGGRGGFGGGGRGGFNNRGGGEESTFVVPAAKCGVIIGRGGETIKQINQQSGAHCELDRRPNENPNEKLFIIRGTPSQIEAAKQMISEKLGQAGGGGPGGPSNGQPGGFGGPGGQGGQGGYPGQWAPPGPTAYHQPFHQQHMNPGAMGMPAQNSGQPDYSQQWIEYYRSLGMHNEAEAIEQQTKAKAAAAQGGAPVSQNPGPPAASAQPSAPAPQASAAAPQQNGAPDYSAQWAQYYRSMGKIKEAELIEAQMKNKQGTPAAQPGGMVPQQPAAAAQAPPVPGPYPAYQAPSPYPYQPAGYPAYGQPAGYQYSQVNVGGPQSAPGSQDQ